MVTCALEAGRGATNAVRAINPRRIADFIAETEALLPLVVNSRSLNTSGYDLPEAVFRG